MNNAAVISSQLTAHSHSCALVSIIIPAYNTAQYIHRAIESSLRQTHTNIEVLVVDDGSSDETLNIAREYAVLDERVRVFTQENAGVSTARNHGIREAKGEYIIFLDSDDWLEDNAVKVLLDIQLTHPDKLIVCNWYIVTIGGKDNNSFIRSKSFNAKTRTMTVVETINACTMIQFPLPTWAKIFSTELIRRYNLTFNERINYGEDQLFSFEYLVKTQGSIYLTEALFDILERSGSLTRSYHKGHESDTNTDEWLDWLPNIDEITPDVRTASCMYAARTYQSRISQAILQAESRSRIRVLQKKAQHLAKYLLSSKAVSTARKIYFVCMVYTPVILAKMFLFVKLTAMSLKRKLAAPDSDIVPYW